MAKSPTLSIVIPSYNEATYIGRLLSALANQKYKDFEVIVSDAQSKDGSQEVVESFNKKLDVNFYEAPPKGPAYGRNQGAKHARGQWLLFLDADDDIDDPNFIEKLIQGAEKQGWQTATAKFKPLEGTLSEKIGFGFVNYHYVKLISHIGRPGAPGYCILTRRSLFENLKGFNENIQFGEDYEYVDRASKKGFGFVTSTYYYVDQRRPRNEGGLRLFWKGTLNEVYRQLFGYKKLEKNSIKYEFGKHGKRGD